MMSSTRIPLAAAAMAALFAVGARVSSPAAAQGRAAGLLDFTELYEKQSSAVVSIDVTQKIKRSRGLEMSEDDPFYEFFRRFGQIPRRGGPERDFDQQSVGSGFI